MIDVVFLLLIFFLCTASFRPTEETLPTPVQMPEGSGEPAVEQPELAELDEVVVDVTREGDRTIWLVGLGQDSSEKRRLNEAAELRTFVKQLASLRNDLPVFLHVAPEVPLDDTVLTVDICRKAGLAEVSLVVSRPVTSRRR